MQSEEAVEIQCGFPWDVDRGACCVISGLAVGHNDVQSVGGAALKDHDQALGTRSRFGRAKSGAGEKSGQRRRADGGKGAVAKKNTASDGHEHQLSALSRQLSVLSSRFQVLRLRRI